MSQLEFWLVILTLVGLLVGGLSIFWARGDEQHSRTAWGRRLFVVTLLGLGVIGLIGASARANGLAPLGLLAGLLVVGMLWESPTPSWERTSGK